MAGNAGEHVCEPRLRINVVQARGLDQRVEDGGALTAAIGSAEQPGLATERHAAQRPFSRVVRQADAAIIEEVSERAPASQHVVYRLGQIVVARELGQLRGEPGVKLGNERRAELRSEEHTSELQSLMRISYAVFCLKK